jgi:hypothetical protein
VTTQSITISKYFDCFRSHETGRLAAMFLKVPGLPFSMWLERRVTSAGWAVERSRGCLRVYCGRLEGTFSVAAG